MSLPLVLRAAAVLVVCAGTLEYLVLGVFLPPPFVVAVLLVALSFAHASWPRPIAVTCMVISVLIPIAAVLGHLRGDLVVAVPIFDTVLFGWLFWNARASLRAPESAAHAT